MIDNLVYRRTTLKKRKTGLFKKAQELSSMCNAEVMITVISKDSGEIFALNSEFLDGNVESNEEVHMSETKVAGYKRQRLEDSTPAEADNDTSEKSETDLSQNMGSTPIREKEVQIGHKAEEREASSQIDYSDPL